MARVVGARQEILVAMDATLEKLPEIHARVARRAHNRIMRTAPRPNGFMRWVDGVEGAPESAVKPGGVIVYQYSRLSQVVQAAFEILFSLSPVLSGEYRLAHRMFIDGSPAADLAAWVPGAEIAITNTVPYARKIEIPAMKMRVPGSAQVYQQAERRLRARFGRIAEIRFTYRAVIEGRQIDQSKQGSAGQPWYWGGAAPRGAAVARQRGRNGRFIPSGHSTVHNRANLRFPTLVIRER